MRSDRNGRDSGSEYYPFLIRSLSFPLVYSLKAALRQDIYTYIIICKYDLLDFYESLVILIENLDTSVH
jgi:hypothetical protein